MTIKPNSFLSIAFYFIGKVADKSDLGWKESNTRHKQMESPMLGFNMPMLDCPH